MDKPNIVLRLEGAAYAHTQDRKCNVFLIIIRNKQPTPSGPKLSLFARGIRIEGAHVRAITARFCVPFRFFRIDFLRFLRMNPANGRGRTLLGLIAAQCARQK